MIIKQLRNRLIEQVFVLTGHEFDTSGISLSEPRNKIFGDLATNAAMVLAPMLKENPMDIAKKLVDSSISKWDEIENINIAKPGFINFDFRLQYIISCLKEIHRSGRDYGTNDTGKGLSVDLEYVSANPTGDLHIGHGRWAVLGDVLSSIYEANGFGVTREYYVNDYGSQIRKFKECVKSAFIYRSGFECDYPEDGYPRITAEAVADAMLGEQDLKKKYAGPEDIEADYESFGRIAVETMVKKIRSTLERSGVLFDVWFDESGLYEDDNFQKTIQDLKSDGRVYKKDGATWFNSRAFGDDKDRVIIRKDGEPTYFASDIMYLADKKKRGFDKFVYILGADHHGYVKRLKAIGQALGIAHEDVKIIIGQLVKLVKGGKALKMSKRKGQVYGFDDLLEEVGKDPVRYFFCANSFDTPIEFDIDLAKERSNKNPVYYVQYAHARIESIIENVSGQGYGSVDQYPKGIEDMSLEQEPEIELAKALILYPDVIYDCRENDSPHYLVQYIYDLAAKFHHFYNHLRVIEKDGLKKDRFNLVLLVKIVLENALSILGIDAPKKM